MNWGRCWCVWPRYVSTIWADREMLFFAFSTYNGRYTPTEERTLDHNPPEPKWEHTNFLTEKLKPEQQGLGFNEGE